ncbi:MAG: UDP-3-O-(3-hydroxymyristoyl)glucosamine N-acyltransferase, partial [Deltaproteobacteria bacterium]|nr:UDP-3-O-(3-hydroxymyristoyl)glucosamine N-acyltransferase [Deltaproteobacteria bacterium]
SEKNDLFQGPQVKVPDPGLGYARVAALFEPPVPRHPGISDRAAVNDSSRIGKDVSIYPMVYVGEDVFIGDHAILFPGVFIGDRVRIGNRTVIYPNVSIWQDCVIGNDVMIHAGTVIGSDGFGFVRDGPVSVKIPQRGIVQIDDEVEIGANNSIDRATLGKTWIQRGVKTDNQVHVAHNVVIGEDSIVVAQTGISGSVRIGREVIIGGQVGVIDHLEIGDGAMVAAQSAVIKDVPPGEVVSGSPSMPHRRHLKVIREIKRLPQLNERLRLLERKVKELEEGL